MYAGHFAAAMAMKGRMPKAPTWGLLLGVGVLDFLFGLFVLLGIEKVRVTPGLSPGFSLDFIDWSHSLLMSVVWSVLFGLLFLRAGRSVAVIMGLAVFSHFVLDIVMHRPDVALWPGSEIHIGLGLWESLPTGWWFVELAFVAACLAYYATWARRVRTFGGRMWGVVITVLVFHVLNAPWFAM